MPEQTKLIEDIERARMRAVPLIGVETVDPSATIRQIFDYYNTATPPGASSSSFPIVRWDVARNYEGLNNKGVKAIDAIDTKSLMSSDPPAEWLKKAIDFPKDTILIVLNGHQFMGGGSLDHATFGQALWNLRDKYKQGGQKRTLIMTSPIVRLPEELRQDFILLDDPLPTEDQLWTIAEDLYKRVKFPLPSDKEKERIIQMGKGLSAFSWEQTVALALGKDGMNMDKLWSQKKKQVEQTVGLQIHKKLPTWKDIRGADWLIEFLNLYMNGRYPADSIVFMDEVEKMFAGIAGDLSGTSQEQHGEFLRWMQDNEIPGLMMVGHPGTGKSFISKALAGQYQRPMIELNVSALKGSLVGQTGEQTRAALKQILAIGRPLIMATSNSLAILPPELKRRFKLGTWFLDLPTDEEKTAVWELYEAKYNLLKQKRPNDQGWTQSEIQVACEMAYNLNTTLEKSAKFVVPISKSDPEKIRNLRKVADKRFNSASHEGQYEYSGFDWLDKATEERSRDVEIEIYDPKKAAQA